MTQPAYPERARLRIKAGQIMDRLEKHINGEIEMSNTQIQAAKILLAKALPDLKAVEHTGDIGSKPLEKMRNDELSREIERVRSLLQPAKGGKEKGVSADEFDSVH
jgi:hypothetical protein